MVHDKCLVLCMAQSWLKNVTFLPPIPHLLLNILPQGRILYYPKRTVSHLYFLLYPQLICFSQFFPLDLRAVTRCSVNIRLSRLGYAVTYVLAVSSWGQELCQPPGIAVLLSVAPPILQGTQTHPSSAARQVTQISWIKITRMVKSVRNGRVSPTAVTPIQLNKTHFFGQTKPSAPRICTSGHEFATINRALQVTHIFLYMFSYDISAIL